MQAVTHYLNKYKMCKTLIVFVSILALTQGQNIVGGTEASIEEFPWIVSLQLRLGHICGASIVSEKWAHTAAHCVFGIGLAALTVRSGSSYHNSGGTIHDVIWTVAHEKYDPVTTDYDYGMVRIFDSFVLGTVRQIVSLATVPPQAGELALVCGWGTLTYEGDTPDRLQKVEVPIVEWSQCKQLYEQIGDEITDRMICAGPLEGGKDSCQGDSGGPMTISGTLVGSVSWGEECARPNYPGVYSNTSYVHQWISDIIIKDIPLSSTVLAG